MTQGEGVRGVRLRGDPGLRQLVWMTAALFLAYLPVATSLATVALHVSRDLGMGNVASGCAVGVAFVATILSRRWAGRSADEVGGKPTFYRGIAMYGVAALLSALSAWDGLSAPASYAVLIAGRLALGLGESSTLVGLMTWGMIRLGPARSGLVIAMVGVSMYGAFAIGGPLGLRLLDALGFGGLMACNLALPLVAGLMLLRSPGAPPTHGQRASFAQVVGRIWMPGMVVCLQGIGFAALGAFIPLYFLSRGWSGAGYALTCFGAAFATVRVLAGSLPDRVGGVRVALVSLLVEACGQALLWLAPTPAWALAGALLTGLGCSMIFPAMGLEAIKRVPPHLRGTAIGAFAAFQDLAYGLTGPVAGWIADRVGYRPIFLVGLCGALLGVCVVLALRRQPVPGAVPG